MEPNGDLGPSDQNASGRQGEAIELSGSASTQDSGFDFAGTQGTTTGSGAGFILTFLIYGANAPVYQITSPELPENEDMPLCRRAQATYVSHFATCSQANLFGKGRKD